MRKLLCLTGATGPQPDFQFLERHGFTVTLIAEDAADLKHRFDDYDVVILACETRNTQHARIWNHERALFHFVRRGGRLLFTAPGIGAWSQVWNAYTALLPVTPLMRSAVSENFARTFRWDREWEQRQASPILPPANQAHPVATGIATWPDAYQGPKPGSFNAYDFDLWAAKPHTDVALRTAAGDVALAFMPYENGRTAFLLADIHDDGGQSWTAWPDRERFWINLLHHLDSGDLRVERTPAGLEPFAPRVPLLPRAPFEFRPSPSVGNPEWTVILTRTDWSMLADNQVAVNVSPTPLAREPAAYGDGWTTDPRTELGIGQVKFYPTATEFEAALTVEVLHDNAVVPLIQVPDTYRWQPHLIVNRLQSQDGSLLIEKRLAVADDVVAVELRILQGKADSFRLRGFNRFHGFLDVSETHLLGQVESGVIFGAAATAPVRWTTLRENPLRYDGEVAAVPSLTLVFTAAMEVDLVKSRLAVAIAQPANVFDAAFQSWDGYFREQVPAFRSDDPAIERLIYGAFLGYKINLYDIPYEPWREPHSCPSKMHFDPQWEQDDVQVATIGKWLRDPSLIARQLLRPFRVGFMLNVNAAYGPMDGTTSGVVSELQQYSIPLREVYLFDPHPKLRRELIRVLLREEAENDAHTPVDPDTGLFCVFSCLGMDDSPRWDLVSPGEKAEWFQSFVRPVVTPDVNATIAHRAAFLGELLAGENDPRAVTYHALAKKRKALIREHLWSEAAGYFVDRIAGETAFSDVLTPMGFVPLLLGAYDAEVSDRVALTLDNEAIFKTPFGLPTVAASHPKFDATSYWRGSIWSRTNWFAVEALQAAGLKSVAAELTHRWLALVIKNGSDLRENFNPLTGNAKCATMFTEGLAGMADVYFKNVVGFRPTLTGFDLDPIALDAATPSFSFGPFRYRGQEITITWDRNRGGGVLKIDESSTPWAPGVHEVITVSAAS